MEITNHAYERYCERVLKVQEKEIKQYLDTNKDFVRNKILELYNSSVFIYNGKYYNQPTANFYVSDNLVLISNQSNSHIMTLFYIDFGFPKETNNKVIVDLMDAILKLRSNREIEIKKHEDHVININVQIQELEVRMLALSNQLLLLEKNKQTLQDNKTISENNIKFIDEQIKEFASKICYSVNYRMDELRNKK